MCYTARGKLFSTATTPVYHVREAFSDGEPDRLQNITFAILKVMEPNAGEREIDRRENHWKEILLSREFGHNRN